MTTTPAHANRMLFLNLPVQDIARSKAFFEQLGFGFNPRFESNDSACMLIGEQAFCMLLTNEKYAEFSKRPMADPKTHSIGLFCFSVGTREEVDAVADAAVAAGAEDHDDAEDYGFMRSRSFYDLDGHGWQVMWMDPVAAELGPEEYMAQQQAGSPA
jgi:predicted lactoylglutathione lyase